VKLRIDPTGIIEYIYSDGLPFPEIGEATVARASNVECNNKDHLWYVYSPKGRLMISHGFVNRAEALRAEVELLERTVLS